MRVFSIAFWMCGAFFQILILGRENVSDSNLTEKDINGFWCNCCNRSEMMHEEIALSPRVCFILTAFARPSRICIDCVTFFKLYIESIVRELRLWNASSWICDIVQRNNCVKNLVEKKVLD